MSNNSQYISKRIINWLISYGVVIIAFCLLMIISPYEKNISRCIVVLYIFVTLIFLYIGYIYVIKPYNELNKAFRAFAKGYTVQDIFNLPYKINLEQEAMLKQLEYILNTKEFLEGSKKQAEYLALQNQINPHFLYNTLEGIRSAALLSGIDKVAQMTEALAMFFRYTISNLDSVVTIEDELANVENYFLIQRFRFGERLNLKVDYLDQDNDEILRCQIPKLILQPIVENAIRHGIEPMIDSGVVFIRFQLTTQRLIITISDNGSGMDKTILDKLNFQLRGAKFELPKEDGVKTRGGIAMVNVNNRIKLLCGDEFGIRVYSTPGLGTDVEMTLPNKLDVKNSLNI